MSHTQAELMTMDAIRRIPGLLERIAVALEEMNNRQRATTPEDIERMGEAMAAVHRGLADLEAQVREGG